MKKLKQKNLWDKEAGIFKGPFVGCNCPIYHVHGERGPEGCPVCSRKKKDKPM
jgi:rubrerythrin